MSIIVHHMAKKKRRTAAQKELGALLAEARRRAISPKRRSAIGRHAANSRWAKRTPKVPIKVEPDADSIS